MKKDKLNAIIKAIKVLRESADDELALKTQDIYPKWEVGKAYEKDFRLCYNDVLYKVLQAHTSQADWTPDVAVSLYVKVSVEEYPEWHQPQGSHDAYMKNDKCSHNEKRWVSDIDYNTYEPGVYGWDEVEGE